ncbi:class I SAM-dependent methyltransferase [Lysobacter enzymogenes]|uniref:3-demethylubiquinone-9 3-methyltransferase n=1 Tax=Lysobacter enzymogenes TaxID=69 RepID=A0A0S2DBN3_LYSEN|nr:class I SAM-dependent methyltransferase [Lysobacter enzymogenes]ALN55887.1 3-demethylubiquinone-9 3-methyltransferase [Lysobacter enzymogenes]QQQ00690.1 class I SAM-dependent methyltransferase [Lysobacter enzymogenes]
MTQHNAAQFEALADLYEDISDWPFRKYIETPSVLARIGDVAGADVLDFGCGAGTYARMFKRAGARRVVGYDLAEGMLASARRRAAAERLDVEFVSALGPDQAGRFDLVLAVYVLPYAQALPDLERMCFQMLAPLRPGGRLIALPIHPDYEPAPSYYEPFGFRMTPDDPREPHRDGARLRLDLFYQQRYDASVHAWYWSRSAIETALHRAGATAVRWHPPQLHAPADAPPELQAYVRRPHAAIVECRRG